MKNEIVKIETTELEDVIKSSGLQIQEGEEIKQSYLPYLIRLAEIQEQSRKINYEKPTVVDEKIARELRLLAVKVRTESSDVKDSRKKIHLLKGNLEQASWNLIAISCKLAEETFLSVEKAREIAEKKRIAELKESRTLRLSAFCDNANIYPLGEMSDNDFDSLINGMELAKIQKEAAEKAAEDARLLAIEAEKAEVLRIKLLNEKLEAEKIEAEKALEAERAETLRLAKIEQQKRDAELAKERAEAEAKQKAIEETARLEREKAETLRKAQESELLKQKKESEARQKAIEYAARIEREKAESENKRLAKEIQDIKDAEFKSENERKEKADNAAKAPKKDKLNAWVESLNIPAPSGLENDEMTKEIMSKFDGFKKWAKSQIETI